VNHPIPVYKILRRCLAVLLTLVLTGAKAEAQAPCDSMPPVNFRLAVSDDSLLHASLPKAKWYTPLVAVAEINAVNYSIHFLDEHFLKSGWAEIKWETIKENMKMNLEWDHDYFVTNMAAHPYHGSLFYNSGRSLGLSPWASSLCAATGSFLWEIYGETDRPSISDLFTTTAGGIAIGEVTHRMSDLVLDERKRGLSRVMHEFLGFVANPVRGVNRLATGRAWRVRSGIGEDRQERKFPQLDARVSAGYLQQAGSSLYLDLSMDYGDAFDENGRGFYDNFHAEATVALLGKKAPLHDLHITGQLWNILQRDYRHSQLAIGIYQQFQHYDSDSPEKEYYDVPYRISEAAAAGPGLIYRNFTPSGKSFFEQRVFLDAIAMGATKSEYYFAGHRDYNFASGWSVKWLSKWQYKHKVDLSLLTDFYRFYSWKGYEHEVLAPAEESVLYGINTQGDVSRAAVLVLRPRLRVSLSRHLEIDAAATAFLRNTHYRYYADHRDHSYEVRVGLGYVF